MNDLEARYAALQLLLVDALGLSPGQHQPEHVVAAVEALRERADNNPCKSCGADPSVYPDTGEEVPIVKGALDEQQRTEGKYFAERQRANALRDSLTSARIALVELQSERGPRPESLRSIAAKQWGEDEARLLFPEDDRG